MKSVTIRQSAAVVLGICLLSGAQAASTNATSQFRRTVEDSERSASGTIRFRQSGTRQFLDVNIKRLFEEDFRIFITTNNATTLNTNDLVFSVAPLDRTSARSGQWRRRLVGEGAAPIEIPIFGDLADLAGKQVHVAQPGTDLTVAVTNLLNCTTNIVGTTTNVNCTTNIVVGVPFFDVGATGFVSSVLWAPIPAFLASPSVSNTSARAALELPGPPDPSPNARGTVRIRLTYTQGRSVLDVRASGLIRGQNYSVWIEESIGSLLFIKAGDMVLSRSGATARFIRDTRYGDPIPQQVGYITELSGRAILILDEFEDPHLVGTIP